MKRKILVLMLSMSIGVSLLGGCGIRAGADLDKENDAWEKVYTQSPDIVDPIENPDKVIGEEDFNQDAISSDKNEDNDSNNSAQKDDAENKIDKVEKKDASIVMVGDVLLHEALSKSGLQADGTYNYDVFFEHVEKDIKSADIALINQEVILGGIELGISGYPCFNGVYEVGDALVKAGFDVILHATNHSLDKGTKGLNNCINFWKEKYPDISYTGINQSKEEQDSILVKEVNGIKIAVLNYTYGTNGIPMPKDMPFAVNLLDEDKIRQDVAKAKKEADFVMVCPHWGTEYTLQETKEQKNWCNLFLELGVDLVVGTHPHVIEPVEWYEREDGHKMLVYYSLGNYINSTASTEKNVAWRYIGAMAKVNIGTDEEGNIIIKDYGVEPLVTQKESGTNGITTYKLSDYTQELADKNRAKNQDSKFSLQYCKEISQQVFGDLYKEE